MHREDDRVTKWIRNNFSKLGNHPNMLIAMTMARFVNRIDTLRVLGFPYEWDPVHFQRVMRGRQSNGEKVWGNAYTISTCGRKMAKEKYVAEHVMPQVVWAQTESPKWGVALSAWHAGLTTIDGLGNFLAAQIVADLKNTPGHPLAEAEDWFTWAAPGPGSMRGVARYFGKKIPEYDFLNRLKAIVKQVGPLLDKKVGPMCMQDWQNCMCEFDKYCRLLEGGHVRNRYSAADAEAIR